MEAIIQEIEVEKLLPIFDIPREIWNSRVEVTIKPIKNMSYGTSAERIGQFRKKYNREVFIEHLKKQSAQGHSFDFNVQKVIDGTETEEETQALYRHAMIVKNSAGVTMNDSLGKCLILPVIR
jgi:hypothetical protein